MGSTVEEPDDGAERMSTRCAQDDYAAPPPTDGQTSGTWSARAAARRRAPTGALTSGTGGLY